jgi:hypothetical protein
MSYHVANRKRTGLGELPYYEPGSWFCNYMPTWVMTSGQQTACIVGSSPAAVTPPPTASQLAATQAAIDQCAPGDDACVQNAANALTQQLTNQAVTQTQQNTQSAVEATDTTSGAVNLLANSGLPGISTPFCGAGSNQLISGLDNCTLLEIAGAVIGVIVLLSLLPKGRR